MASYSYDQDDFSAATDVNLSGLKTLIDDQITSAVLIGSGFTRTSPTEFTVSLRFDGVLSGGDVTILDTIVANYVYQAFADTTAVISDIKATGTNGGTFTQEAWQIRTLNTLVGDVDFVSIASNKFTLKPGKYFLTIKAPASNVEYHRCRLYNVTTSSVTISGSNAYAVNSVTTVSEIFTTVTVTVDTEFRVEHQCSATQVDTGFGDALGFGDVETYTIVSITSLD
jgi:uncharacterized protein (UPF0264 family)